MASLIAARSMPFQNQNCARQKIKRVTYSRLDSMFSLKSVSTTLMIMAPVVIVIMVVWLMVSCAILFSSARADGRVVQLIENGQRDNLIYIPVFVFRDGSGIEHTNRATGGSNPPRFPVGSKVSVLYRTQNPENGQIDDRLMLWVVPMIFIAISIFYGAVGYLISRALQKKDIRNTA
jgi:hypothetical protein